MHIMMHTGYNATIHMRMVSFLILFFINIFFFVVEVVACGRLNRYSGGESDIAQNEMND